MKYILIVLALIVFTAVGWFANDYFETQESHENPIAPLVKPRPLEKYTIDNLTQADIPEGVFKTTGVLDENATNYSAQKFSFEFVPDITGKETKTTTGQINFPNSTAQKEKYPLVVMIRGYVDQELYTTGTGTKRAAEYFAQHGFITVAPDFLGYAESSPEAGDIFETRFQTYTTLTALLKSLDQVPEWDGKNVFIWAHSNGGQVALTTAEIMQFTYPMALWAPVTAPFPYSVLYYTNESEDKGKLIRHDLAKFEELYDVDKYSLDDYFDRLAAPIQLHWGTGDDAIPEEWIDRFVANLKNFDKDVTYYRYPGSDHNLQPAWNTVVARDLDFFKKHLENEDV